MIYALKENHSLYGKAGRLINYKQFDLLPESHKVLFESDKKSNLKFGYVNGLNVDIVAAQQVGVNMVEPDFDIELEDEI